MLEKSRSVHISIVDDDDAVLDLVKQIIEHLGFKCSVSKTAHEALERVLNDPTLSLLISDFSMPGMNGIQLIRSIRDVNTIIPIVLVTGYGNFDVVIDALRAGATDYLNKPLSLENVKHCVERILGQQDRGLNYYETVGFIKKSSITFDIRAPLVNVTAISSYLSDYLYHLGYYTLSEKLNFGLALNEAIINANDHGNLDLSSALKESEFRGEDYYNEMRKKRLSDPAYNKKALRIVVKTSSKKAVIIIKDEGNGFDVQKYQEFDPLSAMMMETNHGRGMILMRLYTDELTYNDRGNEITLVKYKQ